MNQNKTTVWQKFSFSDVSLLMKNLGKRAAEPKDLNLVPYINSTLQQKDTYPEFSNAIGFLRKSPIKSLIKFEKKQFISMFFIHIIDVIASLTSAIAAIQLLRSFEQSSNNFRLITAFYHNPNLNETLVFAIILATLIFLLNILAASLHAQKIEREMLLSWRIPFNLMKYIYTHLLYISKKDRASFQTGDITNMAQNDSRFLGDYLAHAMVDIPVLIVSCILVMIIMVATIGNIAWIGFIIICLQIPISIIFTWIGNKLHQEMMRRGDKRLQIISEWIHGVRPIRYFGWGQHFKNEINQATLSEYKQDLKITVKYCIAFAITHNWWMVVSSAIFSGIVFFHANKNASTIFAAIWFCGILGQQITPLPWFVNAWSQAIVASKRLKKFYNSRTQIEEFPEINNKLDINYNVLLQKITNNKNIFDISISFSLKNIFLRFSDNEPYVLNNVSLDIPSNKTLAIVGPVASGKSVLIQVIMGDIVPNKGEVLFSAKISEKNRDDIYIKGNVHTEFGINFLRLIQSYVPQEAFIISSTIRDNIPLKYNKGDTEFYNDSDIINSLYAASFKHDFYNLEHGLETEIGERGVNLSGGQKQRVSLSRSAFKNSSIIFFDDPLSAVDNETEKELVQNIFVGKWGKNKTIIWATHRMKFLNYANNIILMEKGRIIEQGSYQDVIQKKNSRLHQYILGLQNYE